MNEKERSGDFRKPKGKILILLATGILFSCWFGACGYTGDNCELDCEDTSKPGSLQQLKFEDMGCDECDRRYGELKEEICGPLPNPDCRCHVYCGHDYIHPEPYPL